MNKQPTIVIVGTGNLAWHLCNAFKASKLNLIGIASRNLQESEKFATEFELKSYPIDNIPNSDIVIIAVKDTTIHEVSSALKINCNTIIAHTSGAASMEQIDDKFENKGVFYPFQTFTKKRELAYQNIPIFTESSNSETKKILGLIAKKNIVLNTGHLSAKETINLVKYAKKIGVKKILIPSNTFNLKTISELKKYKVKFEFSYFFISKATNVPLTHVDGEKHKIQGTNENLLKLLIKTANPKNVILSSDCGVSILPKPYIGFSKFINQIIKLGFSKKEIEYMIKINSKKLFSL